MKIIGKSCQVQYALRVEIYADPEGKDDLALVTAIGARFHAIIADMHDSELHGCLERELQESEYEHY